MQRQFEWDSCCLCLSQSANCWFQTHGVYGNLLQLDMSTVLQVQRSKIHKKITLKKGVFQSECGAHVSECCRCAVPTFMLMVVRRFVSAVSVLHTSDSCSVMVTGSVWPLIPAQLGMHVSPSGYKSQNTPYIMNTTINRISFFFSPGFSCQKAFSAIFTRWKAGLEVGSTSRWWMTILSISWQTCGGGVSPRAELSGSSGVRSGLGGRPHEETLADVRKIVNFPQRAERISQEGKVM